MGNDTKYIGMLKELILEEIDRESVAVFLFGSRAAPNQASGSSRADVDIGLLAESEIPMRLIHRLRNRIDDSIVPLEVDLVDFTRVDVEFKDRVLTGRNIVYWNMPKTMKINCSC